MSDSAVKALGAASHYKSQVGRQGTATRYRDSDKGCSGWQWNEYRDSPGILCRFRCPQGVSSRLTLMHEKSLLCHRQNPRFRDWKFRRGNCYQKCMRWAGDSWCHSDTFNNSFGYLSFWVIGFMSMAMQSTVVVMKRQSTSVPGCGEKEKTEIRRKITRGQVKKSSRNERCC